VLAFALVAGGSFGVISAASMAKIEAPSSRQKREAMAAALVDRFLIGFVIGPVARGLNWNGVLIGALLGFGLSLPSALVTRAHIPILAMGMLGGLAVGIAYALVY
jgi:hypothetical protein